MIEEITIVNNTLNQSITLNKGLAKYLLDNDKSIDWGTVSAKINTYDLVNRVGLGLTDINMSSGRNITITGWLIGDTDKTIEDKKRFLNSFCNPYNDITIIAGKYKIDGNFSEIIKYSNSNSENNEIICKFVMYIFCANPLFSLVDPEAKTEFDVYSKKFIFPLSLPSEKTFVFGLRQGLNDFILHNSGTLSTGLEVIMKFVNQVGGLSIKNETTGEELKLKSSVTMEAGDVLYINTIPGQRLIMQGTTEDNLQNAFSIFDVTSDFVQLQTGDNRLKLSATSGLVTNITAKFQVAPLFYALEEQ